MRKVLWIGDAGCQTGFARSTHKILEIVTQQWDVTVLGMNYRGDPHPYPYLKDKLYPARDRNGDWGGIGRVPEMLHRVRPDIVVVQNDPWNFPAYMKYLKDQKVLGIVAVDGKNCQGQQINGLTTAVFWTEFARQEAIRGGYIGDSRVIPLGVDRAVYYPQDRKDVRSRFGLKGRYVDAFIVGNVNRNQARKRMDLTLRYFAKWVKGHKISDAYLFLHTAPTGDNSYDCEQLAAYYGIESRLILNQPDAWNGLSEEAMCRLYNVFDVQVTTTQGEGFGLTTLEGMACGVPQIVPDWSALGEWPGEDVAKVFCSTTSVTPGGINVVGGIPDESAFITELDNLYTGKKHRIDLGARGFVRSQSPEFEWNRIGAQFCDALEATALSPLEVLTV